jgi:Fe-S-cluster containining protein
VEVVSRRGFNDRTVQVAAATTAMKARRRSSRPAANAPIDPADLEKADRTLLEAVAGALATPARRAGTWLACRPGCSECCMGPFPINLLDVSRLRRGLADLAARDAQRAAAIEARARSAVETLRREFPGDPESGRLCGDEQSEDLFFERHAALPCPVLDPQTGTCDLYDARPMSCRTYGPPVRIGGEDLPPCRLCFDGAPPGTVEACRVQSDPGGIERAIVERLERGGAKGYETIVAFAVSGPGRRPPEGGR